MNRSLIRAATYVQLFSMTVLALGCTPTQPFFLNESPNLRHYLSKSTQLEHPDADIELNEEVAQALPPLTLGNHDYEYWDLTLEECVSMALHNAKFFMTVSGISEQRQNVTAQVASGSSAQIGSIYDVAQQQTTTQSVPISVDGAGNRILGRGVQRANQVGGVEDALAEFDAQVSGVMSYGTTDRPRNVATPSAFNQQLFQATDSSQQLAISKRMATGGVITARQQVIYSSNNLQVGGLGRAVRSDWTAIVEAQITHPLMRGRGTMINRIPVVLASLNEDISIAEYEAQVRNLVRDVEVAYWDLYCNYRNVETEMLGRNGTQKVATGLINNFKGGSSTIQDVRRAEQQYYEFRTRLEGALAGSNVPGNDPRGVYGAERELRSKLGLAATDGRLIRPIDSPTIAHVDFDWFETTMQASYNSPEVRRSKVRLKQRELELIAARNQILPELNLSLTGRLVGVGDELGLGSRNGDNFPVPGIGTSAVAGLTEGNFGEFGARVEFTPTPIGQRREQARINNAQREIVKERAFIDFQELALNKELSDAIAKLETHYRQIQSSAHRLNAAQQSEKIRREGFEELSIDRDADGTVNFLLDSQLILVNAQITFYRALCEYNKSICYVHYLKGTLLEYNSIQLEEGPWAKKAYWDALERARERSAGYAYQYGVERPNVVRRESGIEVDPTMLPPQGIADGLLLGDESILDESPYSVMESGQPTPMEQVPMPGSVDEMDELKMPAAPSIELVPAPQASPAANVMPSGVQPAVGSGVRGLNRPASYQVDAGSGNGGSDSAGQIPRVKRRPIPVGG